MTEDKTKHELYEAKLKIESLERKVADLKRENTWLSASYDDHNQDVKFMYDAFAMLARMYADAVNDHHNLAFEKLKEKYREKYEKN